MIRARWVAILVALAFVALGISSSAMASTTLSGTTCNALHTSGCIGISGSAGGPFTVTFSSTFSGTTTSPTGTYSFNGVGPLTFGPPCVSGSGCPFASGTGGTLTLDGATVPIHWTLLDGDGSGITLDFGTGNDMFLNPTATYPNFNTLLATGTGGSTVYFNLSSGEAPEASSIALLSLVLLGGLVVGRKRLFA